MLVMHAKTEQRDFIPRGKLIVFTHDQVKYTALTARLDTQLNSNIQLAMPFHQYLAKR